MNNSTNGSSQQIPDRAQNYTWIAAQVLTTFMLFSTVNVMHSLRLYGSHNQKWSMKSLKKGKSNQVVLAFTACVTMFLSLLATEVLVIYTINHAVLETLTIACYYIKIFKHTFTILTFLLANLFLWSRLNTLYRRPAMRHMVTTSFKVASWLALTLWLVATACFAFLLSTSYWVGSELRTCRSQKHSVSPSAIDMVAHWFLGLRVSASVLMIGLLSYPLLVYRKQNLESIKRANVNRQTLATTRNLIYYKIRLATISVATCVITDILIQMINKYALPPNTLRAVDSAIWDLNDYINVRAIIFCYFNYKENWVYKRLHGRRTKRELQRTSTVTATNSCTGDEPS